MYYRTIFAVAAFASLIVPAAQCRWQDPDGIGVSISKTAKAEDVGLPIYPGAHSYKEDSDDSSSALLNAWGGGNGFKLAVIKLQSTASLDKIKDFYRNALSKYGPVLDCTDARAKSSKHEGGKDLTCDNDGPKEGEILLKAGRNDNQHDVAIKKEGNQTIVALLHIRGKG